MDVHPAKIDLNPNGTSLRLTGDWTLAGLVDLQAHLRTLRGKVGTVTQVMCEGIDQFDSAGAYALSDLLAHCKAAVKPAQLARSHQTLFDMVWTEEALVAPPVVEEAPMGRVTTLGFLAIKKWLNCLSLLSFMGEIYLTIGRIIHGLRRVRWKTVLKTVEQVGYQGMPIVALLSFLIGVVLAYQMGIQLQTYGANIYIVDLSGMAVLREFGPLITAIIVAGRSSTAFASQMGTMLVNEELDALITMGVSPIERLVVPKIFGALIAVPLLTVWAMAFGLLGSMIMAKQMLGISYFDFIQRFHSNIPLKTYVVGMVKTPVFAWVVATVVCYQGFQVARSADSVGEKTTKAAVQAIFLIIIIDAVFSVFFSMKGI